MPASACSITPTDRRRVSVTCSAEATLVRRELSFPGWEAFVNGEARAVGTFDGLFQSVALGVGKSDVRFDYSPPYSRWAWAAALLGVMILCASFIPLLAGRRSGSSAHAAPSRPGASRDRR
jgi:hypothetical protein